MQAHQPYLIPEIIFQGEIAECGLACIGMLAAAVKKPIAFAELRERFPISAAGASMEQLVDILSQLGISAFPVKFNAEEVADLPVPAIVHFGGNHFVMLSDKKGSYIRVFNPATGVGIFHTQVLGKYLTGFGILLDPIAQQADSQESVAPKSQYVKKERTNLSIRNIVTPNLHKLLGMTLLTGLIAFVIPVLFSMMLDGNALLKKLAFYVPFLVIAGVSLISAVAEAYMAKLQVRTVNAVSLRYIPALFAKLLKKKHTFFEKRAMADIHQRFLSFSHSASERGAIIVSQRAAIAIGSVAVSIMFWTHFLLGALAILTILIFGVITMYYTQARAALLREIEEATGQKNDFVFESIRGIGVVKTAELYKERGMKFSVKYERELKIAATLKLLDTRQGIWYKLVGNVDTMLMLACALYLFNEGTLSIGVFFAFSFFKQIAMSSASNYYLARVALKQQDVIDQRAQDIITYEEDVVTHSAPIFESNITIKDMNYGYEKVNPILKNISLEIRHGEKIAIIGKSGSGKSTLLKLIAGSYLPTGGSLHIDGHEEAYAKLHALCYYQQTNDALFHATVTDNIALFDQGGDRISSVLRNAERVGLKQVIEELPFGWNTMISENNPLMSSGQRQRLLVARALSAQKSMVLLDEPTANLDFVAASSTIQAILASDKTVIVALHDHALLTGFDHIFVVAEGNISLHTVSADEKTMLHAPMENSAH